MQQGQGERCPPPVTLALSAVSPEDRPLSFDLSAALPHTRSDEEGLCVEPGPIGPWAGDTGTVGGLCCALALMDDTSCPGHLKALSGGQDVSLSSVKTLKIYCRNNLPQ